MAFASPGNMSPGGSFRAAPDPRAFVTPAAPVRTAQVSQAPNSTSGGVLIATAAASAFSYKDASGVTVALTGLAAGVYDLAGIAMSEIVSSTTRLPLAPRHGTGPQAPPHSAGGFPR